LASFSDPHYFATNLLINDGLAFQTYLAQDRKLIAESVAITEAVVDQLIARNANYVFVTGDLTKDGELDSHTGFAAELARLEAAGAQVLVIPGNHDINSPSAVAYDGTNTIPVPTVSPEQFRSIYAAYGYDLAQATDPASVAYSVALTSNILMVCMDSCQYGVTAGSFDAARLAWITHQLAAARAQGKLALGLMHHGLMEHFQGQKTLFSEYVLDDHQTVAPLPRQRPRGGDFWRPDDLRHRDRLDGHMALPVPGDGTGRGGQPGDRHAPRDGHRPRPGRGP
jgi:3',5'-cyclic AMP phosphodiesterase CpdA